MIKDRWFGVPVIGLLIIFIIKFISFLDILKYFPLNKYPDLSDRLSELYLLANYGFHSIVPLWYGGFKLFEIYSPGWHFFSLPFYWLTNNIQLTALISLVLMLVFGFIASCLIFRKLSKKIIFFVLFFMNPIMIDYIFFIGRFSELFGWVVYLFIFYLVFKYKNKELDKLGMGLFIIFISISLISHQYVSILSLFLVFLLFLIKPKKEKFLIILALFVSLLLTSFFWIDFLRILVNNPYAIDPTAYQKGSLLGVSSIISFNTFVLFGWFMLFYFYNKQFINSNKEKLFFYPLLILSIFIITRVVTLIPLFNEVPPNAFNLFFISLSLFMLFKIKFSGNVKKLVILSLVLIPILTAILAFEIRPDRDLQYTPEQEEMISYLSEIEGRYLFIEDNIIARGDSLISIATINFNLSTPLGLSPAQLTKELDERFKETDRSLENVECSLIIENFEELEVGNIITYKDSCDVLRECGLNMETEGEYSCLFVLEV